MCVVIHSCVFLLVHFFSFSTFPQEIISAVSSQAVLKILSLHFSLQLGGRLSCVYSWRWPVARGWSVLIRQRGVPLPPPHQNPLLRRKQQRVSVSSWCNSCFPKKKLVASTSVTSGRVPYMGKKARPRSVAISGSGGKCISCRGAAEWSSCTVCPACASTLCVQNNKAKLLAVSWSETIPRSSLTALFNGSVWTMCRHRIPACLELAWQLWLQTVSPHLCCWRRRHIYDLRNVPEARKTSKRTMRLRWVDGNRSLELLTLFSCPHQAFRLYHNKRGGH